MQGKSRTSMAVTSTAHVSQLIAAATTNTMEATTIPPQLRRTVSTAISYIWVSVMLRHTNSIDGGSSSAIPTTCDNRMDSAKQRATTAHLLATVKDQIRLASTSQQFTVFQPTPPICRPTTNSDWRRFGLEFAQRQLESRCFGFLARGVASSSRTAYVSGVKKFWSFCALFPGMFSTSSWIPTSDDQLMLFATWLAQFLSPSSVKVFIAVVRSLHIDSAPKIQIKKNGDFPAFSMVFIVPPPVLVPFVTS